MQDNIKKIICSAIKSKQLIQFNYEDSTRIVEPYCYGVSGTGNEVLRAYQVKGQSKSGNPMGWKLFSASKMENIMISDEFFAIGHHYGEESVIKEIYCCI
jgi:predicted DNA-binding transcriptional regulator YafY